MVELFRPPDGYIEPSFCNLARVVVAYLVIEPRSIGPKIVSTDGSRITET